VSVLLVVMTSNQEDVLDLLDLRKTPEVVKDDWIARNYSCGSSSAYLGRGASEWIRLGERIGCSPLLTGLHERSYKKCRWSTR